MATYPKLHGTGGVVVKPNTLKDRTNADGTVWTLTLTGKREAFEALGIVRGTDLGTSFPEFGVPAGNYVDEITNGQVLYGANSDESCYETDIVCRTQNNMGDGVVAGEEPEVFTVDWEVNMLPLAQLQARYAPATMKSFVGSTKKTLYGYIKEWINAESVEVQAALVQELTALTTGNQLRDFQDFIVKFSRGVAERETYYPILTRSKRVNTVTPANQYPGQIVTTIPSGFDDMKPAGTWTWRQMPTRIERIGRSGGYNIIDRWIGDPAWDAGLYGTAAEIGGSGAGAYQTLG